MSSPQTSHTPTDGHPGAMDGATDRQGPAGFGRQPVGPGSLAWMERERQVDETFRYARDVWADGLREWFVRTNAAFTRRRRTPWYAEYDSLG